MGGREGGVYGGLPGANMNYDNVRFGQLPLGTTGLCQKCNQQNRRGRHEIARWPKNQCTGERRTKNGKSWLVFVDLENDGMLDYAHSAKIFLHPLAVLEQIASSLPLPHSFHLC